MNKNKRFSKIICAIFAAVLLASLSLPVLAEGNKQVVDASRPGSLYNESLDSVELLRKILDEYSRDCEIGEAERNYLLAYGNTELVYNYGVSSSNIVAEYDEHTGILSVNAYEYSYSNSAGNTMVWVPISAELDGECRELLNSGSGSYGTTFSGVNAEDELAAVKVTYSLGVTISKNIAATLVNKAYNDAPGLIAEHEQRTAEYEAKLSEYNEAKAAYDSYVTALAKYRADLEKYNDYLARLEIYNEKLLEYEKYLLDKVEYDLALAAHQKYLADVAEYEKKYAEYEAYLTASEAYPSALEAYKKYEEDIKICNFHFKTMWIAAERISEERHAIRSILKYNSFVDDILNDKKAFTEEFGNAPAALFDIAKVATENLKELLPAYFSFETADGKYAFYTVNYDILKKSFTDLFLALHYLQQDSAISSAIVSQNKEDEFNVFVASLYLIAQRFSDGPLMPLDRSLVKGHAEASAYYDRYGNGFTDTKYLGLYRRSLSEILGNYTPVADTDNSKPLDGGYPQKVEKPKEPTPVPQPETPVYVAPPIELEEVKPAGSPPTAVSNPGEAPVAVPEPTAPAPYVQDRVKAELISAYSSGKIAKRELIFNTDPTVTFNTVVEKRFLNVEECSVKFYDTDGETVLYTAVVDSGSMVDFVGSTPIKADDARAFYTFDYWVDRNGSPVDLSRVESDLLLYPHFSEKIKSYTVTWNVNGTLVKEEFLYGDTPSFNGTAEKPDSDYCYYTFAGWDKLFVPVTGDVTYTAVFDSRYIVPITGGGAYAGLGDNGYTVDLTTTADSQVDIFGVIARAVKENCAITVNIKSISIFISKSDVLSLESLGACYVSAAVAQSGNLSYTYRVDIKSSRDPSIDIPVSFKLSARCPLDPSQRLRLKYQTDDGSYKYLRYSLEDGMLSFDAQTGYSYSLAYEYNLIPASSALVSLGLVAGTYPLGEMVYVSPKIPEGVSIKQMYYTDSAGNRTVIEGNRFFMPDKDITVVVEAERIKYKITFVNEGKTISEAYYYYGDTPTVPTAPKKMDDGKYSYTFSGWSEQVCPVTEDAVYVAVYASEEIPENLDTDRTLTLSQKGVLAVFAVAAVILLGTIIALIVRIRSV